MAKLCQALIQSIRQLAISPGQPGPLRILMAAPHKNDACGMKRTLFITAGIYPWNAPLKVFMSCSKLQVGKRSCGYRA